MRNYATVGSSNIAKTDKKAEPFLHRETKRAGASVLP